MFFKKNKKKFSFFKSDKQRPRYRLKNDKRQPGSRTTAKRSRFTGGKMLLAKAQSGAKGKLWLVVGIIAGLLVLIVAAYFVLLTNTFSIQRVLLYEADRPGENPKLLQAAQTFRGDNLILVNTQKVTEKIVDTGVPIRAVRIVKDLPDELRIAVDPVPDAFNLVLQKDKVEHKFVVNEAGYITKVDGHALNKPYMRLYVENLPAYQDQYLRPDRVKQFVDILNYFDDQFNLPVNESVYYPVSRELHLVTARDFAVWLDLEMDFVEQLDKLKDAIPRLNIYEMPLEYVDLRIEGVNSDKIIYKPR